MVMPKIVFCRALFSLQPRRETQTAKNEATNQSVCRPVLFTSNTLLKYVKNHAISRGLHVCAHQIVRVTFMRSCCAWVMAMRRIAIVGTEEEMVQRVYGHQSAFGEETWVCLE